MSKRSQFYFVALCAYLGSFALALFLYFKAPKAEAVRLQDWVPVVVNQSSWPPCSENGHLIVGPLQVGTAEQIGAPMYGWTPDDRTKHDAGGKVFVNRIEDGQMYGVILD